MTSNAIGRSTALALLGGAATILAGCGRSAGSKITIGSKDFTEELILGEMYAQILEQNGFTIDRRLDLGGTQIAMEALRRGDIDLYPEYTGTALITQLRAKPSRDAAANIALVRREYASRYRLEWLEPAPFNDTQALATTQAIAAKYEMRTLSDLAKAAPHLRLGAIPEFTKREDGLPGLQKAYGGFAFADVKLFEIGLKYKALETGRVDVVVAFGTDGQIDVDKLLVFEDDKQFWPTYQVAPVVRAATLATYPAIATHLDKLAPLLTDGVMRGLNAQVDGEKKDPADVARTFLTGHGFA
ncbi:MAG: quaternary ammonium transporter [Candidatus Eremiobacteraeota bacterium]|nr:quaternary ammonium transporter [Candidatus Eremiobacteraeota bacterium]